MPKGTWVIRPHKLHVIVGRPIDPARDGLPARAAVRSVSAELHRELQRLFDAAQARVD
jgi:hypothetical protein